MSRSTKWWVYGEQREVRTEEGVEHESVVVISEPGGFRWELTMQRNEMVGFRMVRNGERLRPRHFSHLPITELERTAREYLRRVDEHLGDGYQVPVALDFASRRGQEAPTLAEFAEAWKAIPEGVPKRQELADRYGVTTFAIDKRIRQAREQNLLPRPTKGRGHTRETRAN